MCGIAGAWGPPGSVANLEATARRMADAIRWRGPDGGGTWCDAEAGVAFGHRRLAIIDLTPTGAQPMSSADGRYTLTYNGEVYNFKDLREELGSQGVAFRSMSDTEVLLEGFTKWGIVPTLQRVVGMFALAVWDRQDRRLTLARDRLGEKPLYYCAMGGTLLFGSDPAALYAHPAFRGSLDPVAVAQYLRFGYVPAPRSIFRNVSKLLPGHVAHVTDPSQSPTPETYWDPVAEARKAQTQGPPVDPVADLDGLLRKTIRRSMVSDVPLGVFLSGGIDSSTVAALMQAESETPVHTFTIGFREAKYNEADDARRVAEHLGTHHTEYIVTPQEARQVIPLLPSIYHEPFADSSQIPTFLVSRLARQHVTVAISGDGGDELFGGYNRYVAGAHFIRLLQRIPRPLRRRAGKAVNLAPAWLLEGVGRLLLPLAGRRGRNAVRQGTLVEKARRIGTLLIAPDPAAHYLSLVSIWPEPNRLLLRSVDDAEVVLPVVDWPGPLEERMMLQDTLGYLHDDVLAKVDRASMAVSLETRAPLLSQEVFAAAWQLPLSAKIHGGQGKQPLRAVLDRYVPRHLVDRPKTGFAVPIGEWLRGPLRDWGESLLSVQRIERDGLFDPAPVRSAWNGLLDGRLDCAAQVWVILMFQAWLDEHRDLLEAA